MKLSDIFKFKLFEGGDKANLKIVNENFEIAEKELAATNKEITDKVTEINNRITELNNLLGGKLDVTKIANNLVTTEEGYALDARMGKALSEDVKSRPSKKAVYLLPNESVSFEIGNFQPYILMLYADNLTVYGMYQVLAHFNGDTGMVKIIEHEQMSTIFKATYSKYNVTITNIWSHNLSVCLYN